MQLPFSQESFFKVFTTYNTSVWPSQLAIYVAAIVVFIFLFRKAKYGSVIISSILAGYWIWMAVMYHWLFFSLINPAARIFGAIFLLQSFIFLYEGVWKKQLTFSYKNNIKSQIGIFFMVFGIIIYPLLGYFLGHRYPDSPTFGLPCPTTIFTLGVLLLAQRIPKYTVIIPFLWSVLGFTAALSLGVYEDISLLIAGVTGILAVFFKQAEQ